MSANDLLKLTKMGSIVGTWPTAQRAADGEVLPKKARMLFQGSQEGLCSALKVRSILAQS
jgi:hypothetical protein